MIEIDGAVVKQLRRDRFLSMRALAERAGIAWTTIHRLESGAFGGRVRPMTARALADALDVDPSVIVAQPNRQSEKENE